MRHKVLEDKDKIPLRWFVRAVKTDYSTAKYDITMADGSIKTILITANPMDDKSELPLKFKHGIKSDDPINLIAAQNSNTLNSKLSNIGVNNSIASVLFGLLIAAPYQGHCFYR